MQKLLIVVSLITVFNSRADNVIDEYEYASTKICNFCLSETCNPTIKPSKDFSPTRDRLGIQYELMGLGTALEILTNVLTDRSDYQRLQIFEEYIMTGSTLPDDIAEDGAGKSLGILVALTKPLPLFYAEELFQALHNKDFDAVIEIMTSLPSCAIRKISVVYRIMYGISLSKHISSATWWDFKYVLMSLAKGARAEYEGVVKELVKADVKALHTAGVDTVLMVDSNVFTEVLTMRPYQELKAAIEAYDSLRKRKDDMYVSIEADIDALFSNEYLKKTYFAILDNMRDQHAYFAKELDNVLSAPVTDVGKRKLIRILRGRCELDLEDIKKKYLKMHRKSLPSRIRRKFDPDFERTLFAVLKS